jgi:hypothetical protein
MVTKMEAENLMTNIMLKQKLGSEKSHLKRLQILSPMKAEKKLRDLSLLSSKVPD